MDSWPFRWQWLAGIAIGLEVVVKVWTGVSGRTLGGEEMKAFVLIKVEPGKLREVLDRISSMMSVSEVYCVTGPDDIIAVLDSEDARGISEVVISGLHGVEGIKATDTRLVVEIP